MGLLVGIDGGGTKTAIEITSINGERVAQGRFPSLSPVEYGIAHYSTLLKKSVTSLLEPMNMNIADVTAVCVGVPCFGEYRQLDSMIIDATKRLFPHSMAYCVNDCVVVCVVK